MADACRNLCACRPSCGLIGVTDPEATCDADGVAGEQSAESVGCRQEYDLYIACIYTASCKDLANGCEIQLGALIRCEGLGG